MTDEFGLEAASKLGPEDFYRSAHAEIFQAIRWLDTHGKAVAEQTVAGVLRRHQLLENIGGEGYLTQCRHRGALTVTAPTHVQTVAALARLRRLEAAAIQIQERIHIPFDSPQEVFEYAAHAVQSVTDDGEESGGLRTSSELTATVFERLEQAACRSGHLTGLSTGFDALDYVTAGLQPGELILLAARTSVGKSALAGQIALHVAKQGQAAAYFSFEMPAEMVMLRLMAIEARIDLHVLRSGLLKPEQRRRLLEARSRLDAAALFIEDSTDVTTTTLRSRLRRFLREARGSGVGGRISEQGRKGMGLVVVDHIGIMPSPLPGERGVNRYLEVGAISRDLLRIAREYDIPVLALAQVHRQADGRRPDLKDLRESGNLEQDARTVLFLHRPHFSDEPTEEPLTEEAAEIYVAKNNNGPRNVVIPVTFLPSYAAFVDRRVESHESRVESNGEGRGEAGFMGLEEDPFVGD